MDSDFRQNTITRPRSIFWLLSSSLGYNLYVYLHRTDHSRTYASCLPGWQLYIYLGRRCTFMAMMTMTMTMTTELMLITSPTVTGTATRNERSSWTCIQLIYVICCKYWNFRIKIRNMDTLVIAITPAMALASLPPPPELSSVAEEGTAGGYKATKVYTHVLLAIWLSSKSAPSHYNLCGYVKLFISARKTIGKTKWLSKF